MSIEAALAIKDHTKRIAELEKLVAELQREIAELKAKRPPGRPRKDND